MPDTASESTSVLLMSPDRVHRSLNRMAYQITEDNRDDANILLLGLKKRGFTVAQLLAERLQTLSNKKVEAHQFIPGEDSLDHSNEDFPYVILVDDVIFSGRTMLDALQHLAHSGSGTIRTAVLVDRGHRSVPVEASFAGLELPTKLNEHVHVETAEALVIKVVLNYSSH